MSIFEYDKEEEERKLRKAEYEAGREEGIKEGELQKARKTAIMLNQMNFPAKKIAEVLQVNRCRVSLRKMNNIFYMTGQELNLASFLLSYKCNMLLITDNVLLVQKC